VPAKTAMRERPAMPVPAARPAAATAATTTAPATVTAPIAPPEMRTSSPADNPAPAKKSMAMAALEALNDRRKVRAPETSGAVDALAGDAQKKTELKAVTETRPEPVVDIKKALPRIDVHGVKLASGVDWDGNWPELAAGLAVRGVAQQLAQQSELSGCEVTPNVVTLTLRVPLETLLASESVEKLAASLADSFTVPVKINTEIGATHHTANAAAIAQRAERLAAAEVAINGDQVVQSLVRVFGATIVPGTIRPVN